MKKLFKGIDDTGRKAWWLVELNPLKAPIFEHERKKGRVVFSDYGKILKSGYIKQVRQIANLVQTRSF